MFEVLESRMIVPNMHQLVFDAPAVAKAAQPGQFIIVRAEEDGERIPLSLSDWDAERGTVTAIVMNAGNTTSKIAALETGSRVPTVVGPLGNASEIDKFGSVVCLCGCYGIGSIYPVARALKAKGNTVYTIIEGRSSYLLYWEDKLRAVSDGIAHITRDGTIGFKGHVSRLGEVMASFNDRIDRVVINGCTLLMKRGSDETRSMGIKTIANLNPIMIDGTGMCGVCRVTVGKTTKFACVDGPDFDAHEVDWEELFQRRKSYVPEEARPLRTSRSEKHKCRSMKAGA
ncbi:MAG: sulfide/dihydroorotate dehydrogenase-like FAD/NAD-binding protein [Candidatus Latescibacterota bacterium]|nr:MAG: sulfide/dihydroorotate dehydrogenase-like FAD/NAD-binding protein [Candidatus Latescibacterota bacterium]